MKSRAPIDLGAEPWAFARQLAETAIAFSQLLLIVASAQVVISPTVVELGARQRVASVAISLSATAKEPLRLQAELLRWQQDLNGNAVSEPSDDMVVTPPIVDLQPGNTQVFRVALRRARPGPEELAYRLILEDVNDSDAKPGGADGASIKFRMRYDLPVLVAPAGPVMNLLRWKPCPPAAAPSPAPKINTAAEWAMGTCVRLLNAGNRRVKVETLTLAGDGWQRTLTLQEGENVLVGTEREWRDSGQTGALRSVQVQTARGETLQAEAGDF